MAIEFARLEWNINKYKHTGRKFVAENIKKKEHTNILID